MQKRKIGIIVGSESDFTQCVEAVHYLMNAEKNGLIEVITPDPDKKFIVASVHRHKPYLFSEVIPFLIREKVDAVICGAGWAAHLIGMVDSDLRYDQRNDHITVIGVAFVDEKEPRHTLAAVLSIGDVPGTQAVFEEKTHVGSMGMLLACKIAVEGRLPEITLPDPTKKPHGTYSWEDVLRIATEKSKK